MNSTFFDRYAPLLFNSHSTAERDQEFLMDQIGGVSVYYAPFEYINPKARIVLVGITPGPTQMMNAINKAREALKNGLSNAEAMRLAKEVAAFSGKPMRSNLIAQLDHWGIHSWLKLDSGADLFGSARQLLQTTSLLRYPVFVDGKPYQGAPNMMRHRLLRQHLEDHFLKEVRSLENTLFFGLGPTVQRVLDSLVSLDELPGDRVIGGLLHPSGNCTYRIKYLVGGRSEPVPHATNPATYDAGREAFRARFLRDGGR
jgi:hypothetical protein